MITIRRGRFVFLKQFRHALRRDQLAFPRGFAEPGETPEQTVYRELAEELCPTISKPPVLIGRLVPDSGLSGTTAYVYSVELDDYIPNIGHEGILEAVEIPASDFSAWLCEGHTDDGFTLGAYSLLRVQKNRDSANHPDEALPV